MVVVDGADVVVVSWGDGVKDGFASRGAKPELALKSEAAAPAVPAAAAGSGSESLLPDPDREVNQLLVAAIACRTACRPLSTLPFDDAAASSGWSPSSFGESGDSTEPAEADESAEELFDLPISSAGSGTRG